MKDAIKVFTRYVAKEFGPRRITTKTLTFVTIANDFGSGNRCDNPHARTMLSAQTALGRFSEADDISALAAAMLSDDFRWMNG